MARRMDAEVDVTEVDETEELPTTDGEKVAKEPKAKKEPARGALPEGYVTPIGLAKELSVRQMHTNRAGEIVEVPPQVVYSYIKNAPKEHPFPMETVVDSIGKERQALKLEAGLTWWTEKNERASARRENAAAKALAKAERAAKKETVVVEEESGDEAVATEAE